mgnify:CR=1 FL=1
MSTFVCNFCGGDHGATVCPKMVSYQGEEVSTGEAMESIFDFLGYTLTSEQWDEAKENYGSWCDDPPNTIKMSDEYVAAKSK